MKALTSTRISIRWPPADAYEDADVTVLTSRSGYYVDVRAFNESSGRRGELESVAAGRKEFLPGGKARWTQFLSSAPPLPGNAEESTSVPHPDDPAHVLETGHMRHPDTGLDAPFEEVWKDVEADEGVRVLVLEREDGQGWVVVVGDKWVGVEQGQGWATAEADWDSESWVVTRTTGDAKGMGGVVPLPGEQLRVGDVRQVGAARWVVREI
ncbi:hypothetical protein Q5752_002272 [Cryptotrichosporon argae]